MNLVLLLWVVGLVAAAHSCHCSSMKNTTYDHYRLPSAVKPLRYTLKFLTDLEDPKNVTFTGDVFITLRILEDTKNITLHAKNLSIDSKHISLRHLNANVVHENCVNSVDVVDRHNYFIMYLCENARAGEEYLLTIPFAGVLNNNLNGYYRSSYLDKASNETRWLSVTQFEPAHARQAFPCFDEPNYKARFTVILGHHNNYTPLSNMPVKQMTPMEGKPDWVWSEFFESVPMSTYLVAYSINEFANMPSETTPSSKVQFRTWARPEAIDQCNYAGEVGPKVLQFYEHIFGIKFPLAKIDQIAIPDFEYGAMENWGLITYRETALLYKENVSALSDKGYVARTIAHELAHQWFGNLVTMNWWSDLWLNEGFATYFSSLAVEHISPEFKFYVKESIDNILNIFREDAVKGSHPVSAPVNHTDMFDNISYMKGSVVVRMLHMFLGDKTFYTGLHNYLQKHAYGNVGQDDLWASLTDSAHKFRTIPSDFQIKRIMDPWTLNSGYPIIEVTRDYENNRATVSQKHYLLDTEASQTEAGNCWWVPLSYTSKGEADFARTTPKNWLKCEDDLGAVALRLEDMPGKDEWVMFNIQMAGLYKIKYDQRNWDMIIDTLMSDDFERIHIVNRAQLIEDALTLAASGHQDYDVAMRLIEYLKREREFIPWDVAMKNLANIENILRKTSEHELFKKYMQKILSPIYLHLNGLNDTSSRTESHTTVLHKVLIAGWSCRFEVEDCVARARQYFFEWRQQSDPDTTNTVPTNLRSVVYCSAMRNGSSDDWDFLWNRYKNSNVAAERVTILSVLGCARDKKLLQRYLEWTFKEDSQIRKQDTRYAFSSVARGEVGFHMARDYLLSNIELLNDFFKSDSTEFRRIILALVSNVNTIEDYETLKSFTEENRKLLGSADMQIPKALEAIRITVQSKKRKGKQIGHLLRNILKEDDGKVPTV